MFGILIRSTLALLLVGACSKADHQAAGAKIPAPGSDHLTQIYVIADRVGPGALALDFLDSVERNFPDAKRYVSRPETLAVAENELREWSARHMDWLIVSGEHSLRAFVQNKISWANTRGVILIAPAKDSSLRQELDAKVTWLVFAPDQASRWSKDYCQGAAHFECQEAQRALLFVWPFSEEAGAGKGLVNISWQWVPFLAAAAKRQKSEYVFSFADGFLTLALRPGLKANPEVSTRLQGWIQAQALRGLSR
ncbi:MAG TPA: hypothetical protein VM901_10340 [Bdellovibrionota bacterium]|jgi:hypothetical protein|nr:hypothetical protein [Bdellovibrionota bacterium]